MQLNFFFVTLGQALLKKLLLMSTSHVPNKIIKRPSQEKYRYNLHVLPSTIENFHNSKDLNQFKACYKQVRKKHKKWLETATRTQHRYSPTNYPLTSGELSMIQLQKEELEKKPKKKSHKKRKQITASEFILKKRKQKELQMSQNVDQCGDL